MLHKQSEPDNRNTLAKGIVKRELVEVHHEWMCSQCGLQFYSPGCLLDGMTLNGIILHVKKMREQTFAKHSGSFFMGKGGPY